MFVFHRERIAFQVDGLNLGSWNCCLCVYKQNFIDMVDAALGGVASLLPVIVKMHV